MSRPPVTLRPVTDADVATVLALNEANVALLAPMDEPRCRELRRLADRFDVVDVDGQVSGFVITFAPGTAYDSVNYRWFTDRFADRFYYLDRIALDTSVRRRGIGNVVYDELESVASAYGRMALEVNAEPPNGPSLAFHARRGYAEVGRLGEPGHVVSLQTKELPAT